MMYRHPLNLFFLALGYVGLIVAGVFLVHLVVDLSTGNNFDSFYLFAVVLFSFVSLHSLNSTPNIELHEDGLRIQSFGFHWVWVRWSDIVGLDESSSVLGPRIQGTLVRARGLTVFHRLIALSYGSGITPAFIVSEGLDGYEDLVGIIREKLDERIDQGYLT